MKRGLTLLEILLVVVIVGIVSALGVIQYSKVKEKQADKEATTNLKIIQAAVKAYKIDQSEGASYPSLGTNDHINGTLSLSLPSGANHQWNYSSYSTGCVQAQRNGDDNRLWYLPIGSSDPIANGACS